jgi:hypothetical protein
MRRKRGTLPYVVLITHICRSWRELALGTPGLWTWIDLVSGHNNAMSCAFLERSQPRILHVTLVVHPVWLRPERIKRPHRYINLDELVELIVREIGRIASLHITAHDVPMELAFVLPKLRPLQAPQLRYFGTSRDDIPRAGPTPTPDLVFTGGAPKLTEARISSLILGVPPLSNITSLIIHRPQDSQQRSMSFAQLTEMLLASPFLENLVMEGKIVDRDQPHEIRNVVSLPHLATLHIELENENDAIGHAFMLYLLHTPNIHSLTLVNTMSERAVRSFLEFCDSRPPTPYPHLRRLSLNGGGSIGPLITSLARALPGVTDLRCIVWNTSDVLNKLLQVPRCTRCKTFHRAVGASHDDLSEQFRASGQVPYWPNLRSLTFQYAGDTALYDFIVARELVGCPLERLRTSQFVGGVNSQWQSRILEHKIEIISVDVELEERSVTEPYRQEDFEYDEFHVDH